MKGLATIVAAVVAVILAFAAIRFLDETIAPLFLNSRIERLGENNLPRMVVEQGGTVYCRMKADDFRFPLPPGSRATNLIVSGGFDTVDGSVEARFDGSKKMSSVEYETLLAGNVREGGWLTAEPTEGGLLIKFHYFGDR